MMEQATEGVDFLLAQSPSKLDHSLLVRASL